MTAPLFDKIVQPALVFSVDSADLSIGLNILSQEYEYFYHAV